MSPDEAGIEGDKVVVTTTSDTTTRNSSSSSFRMPDAATGGTEGDDQPRVGDDDDEPTGNGSCPAPSMVPAHVHEAAVAHERAVSVKLRSANEAMRKEIAQRDALEEQMEDEILRLTRALEEALQHSAQIQDELTKEREETVRAMRQTKKVQKSFEKAKEKHLELKHDIKKRKRAAFEATSHVLEEQHAVQENGEETRGETRVRTTNPYNGNGKDSKHDLKWTEMFHELKKFKESHGHCDVPAKWRGSDPKMAKLACWVSTQRTQHKHLRTGKWTNLKPERVRLLQALGFKWNSQPNKAESLSFELRVSQLVEYKQQFGDCNVPQKYEDVPGLGNFVLQQRKHYRLGELSNERIAKLQEIGFQWSLRNRGGSLETRMKKQATNGASTNVDEDLPASHDGDVTNGDEAHRQQQQQPHMEHVVQEDPLLGDFPSHEQHEISHDTNRHGNLPPRHHLHPPHWLDASDAGRSERLPPFLTWNNSLF